MPAPRTSDSPINEAKRRRRANVRERIQSHLTGDRVVAAMRSPLVKRCRSCDVEQTVGDFAANGLRCRDCEHVATVQFAIPLEVLLARRGRRGAVAVRGRGEGENMAGIGTSLNLVAVTSWTSGQGAMIDSYMGYVEAYIEVVEERLLPALGALAIAAFREAVTDRAKGLRDEEYRARSRA